MLVVCPMCSHHGNISHKLIPEKGKYIVCPKCKEKFFISKTQQPYGEKVNSSSENTLNVGNSNTSIPDTDNSKYTQAIAYETDIYHLLCPGCGASVVKPENLKGNTFFCDHCGSIVVTKDNLEWSKQSIENLLQLVLFTENSYDYIQAYRLYSKLIEIDSKNSTFWMGKARNAGYISSYQNQRIDEMLKAFQYAISFAKENEKEALRKDAGKFIFRICCDNITALQEEFIRRAASRRTASLIVEEPEDIFPIGSIILDTLKKSFSPEKYILDKSLGKSLDIAGYHLYIIQIVKGMIEAANYLPHNLDIVNTIIHICETKLPSYGSSEISKYKKDVLKTFIERKKRLDPDYFAQIEKRNERNLRVVNNFLLLFFGILFLILIFYGFFRTH